MEVETKTMEQLDTEIYVLNPANDENFDSCTLNPSPATVEDDQIMSIEAAFNGEIEEMEVEIDITSNTETKLVKQIQTKEEILALKLEKERKSAELKEKKRQMALKAEAEMKSAKLKQFQHLLTKSQFYTKFLSSRIADQMNDKKEVEQKKIKKNQKRKIRRMGKNNDSERESTINRPFKRKAMQLCDYMNDEEIKVSLAETEPETSSTRAIEPAEETFSTNSNGLLVSDRQPSWLTGGVLKRYQLYGYEWLRSLYLNGLNGILADEMGLGKTIQCIALICHLIEQNVSGPHLIIAPMSTLENWVAEFSKFAPGIPTCLYHGDIEKRAFLRRRFQFRVKSRDKTLFPVIISNYETILKDAKHLQRITWKFIIIDEGHRIKNFDCLLIRALKSFTSKNRILLTGTPLQNNLSELWSLLNYILPEIFDKLQVFESLFNVSGMNTDESDEKIAEEEQKNHVVSTIHEILAPFLLRRLKCDVELNLPSKRELLVYAPLTPIQQEYYSQSVSKTIYTYLQPERLQPLSAKRKRKTRNPEGYIASFFDDEVSLEDVLTQQAKHIREQEQQMALEIAERVPKTTQLHLKQMDIMQLRKCCNHPYLISFPLNPDGSLHVDEQLVQTSGKMLVLDAMLPKLKERGHKALMFSQMTSLLDFLQDYCELREYKYSILDGRMNLDERKENINNFNNDPEVFLFLLSTRAGGLGLNLTAADTVIIYDSDWNPQCDLQAVDRCHRIGQKKPVVIYRLVTANTIDQKIVERAASKRKLEKLVMHKDKFKSGKTEKKHFTKSEMLELLKSQDHERVVKTGTGENEKKIFSIDDVIMMISTLIVIVLVMSDAGTQVIPPSAPVSGPEPTAPHPPPSSSPPPPYYGPYYYQNQPPNVPQYPYQPPPGYYAYPQPQPTYVYVSSVTGGPPATELYSLSTQTTQTAGISKKKKLMWIAVCSCILLTLLFLAIFIYAVWKSSVHNSSTEPCDDFYSYACAKWKSHNISGVMESGQGTVQLEVTETLINGRKDELGSSFVHSTIYSMISACLNEELIEIKGKTPLLDFLDSLGGWPLVDGSSWDGDMDKAMHVIGEVTRIFGTNALFAIDVVPNMLENLKPVIYVQGSHGYLIPINPALLPFIPKFKKKSVVEDIIFQLVVEISGDVGNRKKSLANEIKEMISLWNTIQKTKSQKKNKIKPELVSVGELSKYTMVNWKILLGQTFKDVESISSASRIFVHEKQLLGDICKTLRKHYQPRSVSLSQLDGALQFQFPVHFT
uniref:Proliferation-associated SNF2-like protein n=1 Tax=Strigamia maritima TaxID=126957 RepID=T1J3S6_STRMM